jgi:hypothetical protein
MKWRRLSPFDSTNFVLILSIVLLAWEIFVVFFLGLLTALRRPVKVIATVTGHEQLGRHTQTEHRQDKAMIHSILIEEKLLQYRQIAQHAPYPHRRLKLLGQQRTDLGTIDKTTAAS